MSLCLHVFPTSYLIRLYSYFHNCSYIGEGCTNLWCPKCSNDDKLMATWSMTWLISQVAFHSRVACSCAFLISLELWFLWELSHSYSWELVSLSHLSYISSSTQTEASYLRDTCVSVVFISCGSNHWSMLLILVMVIFLSTFLLNNLMFLCGNFIDEKIWLGLTIS